MLYDLHQLAETETWTQFGIFPSISNINNKPNELGQSVAISGSGLVFAAGCKAGVQVYQTRTPSGAGNATVPFAPTSSLTGAPSGTVGGPPPTVSNAPQKTSEPVAQVVKERPEDAPSAPSAPSSPAAAPVGEYWERWHKHKLPTRLPRR